MIKQIVTLSLTSVFLLACNADDKDDVKKVAVPKATAAVTNKVASSGVDKKWYTSSQRIRGKAVFKANCASCHGDKGQGLVKDWKKSDTEGKFPAPPLNGTAHAWHHSKELLLRTVNNGGIPLGGTMPAFKDKLSDKEKEAVIAYITSLWPDKTYAMWAKRNLK